jgi:serine/threonine protein kinase
MEGDLDDRLIFSGPHLVRNGAYSQSVRCQYRLSRKGAEPPSLCILNFFPPQFRSSFEREVAIYRTISEASTTLKHLKYVGYGEWSFSKYKKTIGRNTPALDKSSPTSTVYVLMLDYIEGVALSSISPTVALVKAVLSSLLELHQLGIVHGNVCTDNVLIVDEQKIEVMLIDYSSSWFDASTEQKGWEFQNVVEYFARLVYSISAFANHRSMSSLVS